MNKHVIASALVAGTVLWTGFLMYAVPPWLWFWWNLSDGAFWGLIGALSPLLIAVYAVITWVSSK